MRHLVLFYDDFDMIGHSLTTTTDEKGNIDPTFYGLPSTYRIAAVIHEWPTTTLSLTLVSEIKTNAKID